MCIVFNNTIQMKSVMRHVPLNWKFIRARVCIDSTLNRLTLQSFDEKSNHDKIIIKETRK